MPLLPEHIAGDPLITMCAWIDEARTTAQPQPTAMALATSGHDARPSARMVFVRTWDAHGLAWLTDDGSRKARDIRERPDAAGVFFWAGLGRQLRVEGPVHLLERTAVDALFARRRPETRAAAWAWHQGETLEGRADLIRRVSSARGEQLPDTAPPSWVGHRLEPHVIEFWQEDPDGLHDRLVARRHHADWRISRVAP